MAMDPSSHHAFSRQLACMAGHAYPHSAPPQQQGHPDPLGMMDPKMGPMMRALTEDNALLMQQQQMGIHPGMYPQGSSYHSHQLTTTGPFSPGRNHQGMSFYPQGHGADYSAALQAGSAGYAVSPTGYYQRQIPTPSPVIGGSMGSPNGQHHISSYPRSASAGPTIPSPIMMQGSSVYSNSYGVLTSTSPQLSQGSPSSLPPRSMRSPAGLQSPKSLPTSSPVPFSCSSPPVVNSGAYGHNQLSSQGQSAANERQFVAGVQSPSHGRAFQYSPYFSSQGQPHPISVPSQNRSMKQTDNAGSPPFVELVHSDSSSPLSREVDLMSPSSDQKRTGISSSSNGSLPKLEEMVAFLGASSMNAVNDLTEDRKDPGTSVTESRLGGQVPQKEFDDVQPVMQGEPRGNNEQSGAESLKPSPLVIRPISKTLPPNLSQEAPVLSDPEDHRNVPEHMEANSDGTGNDSVMPAVVMNGEGQSSFPSPPQLHRSVPMPRRNGEGMEEGDSEKEAGNMPSPSDSVEPSVPRNTAGNRSVIERQIDKELGDERYKDMNTREKKPADCEHSSQDRGKMSVDMSNGAGEKSPTESMRTNVTSQVRVETSPVVGETLPHRTSERNCSPISDSYPPLTDVISAEASRISTEPQSENVAKKDIKGVVRSIPNSAAILSAPVNISHSGGGDAHSSCEESSVKTQCGFVQEESKIGEQKELAEATTIKPEIGLGEGSDKCQGNVEKMNVNSENEDDDEGSIFADEANGAIAEHDAGGDSPNCQEQPVTKKTEPPTAARLSGEDTKEKSSEDAQMLPITRNNNRGSANSTQISKAGVKVAGNPLVKRKPILVNSQSAAGAAVSQISAADKNKLPVFLVAAGESKLRMCETSVVITPIRLSSSGTSSTSPRAIRKRPVVETAGTASQSSPCKKRPIKKAGGEPASEEKKSATKAKPDAANRRGSRGNTTSKDRLKKGAPETPSGDQSTLPLKKRKSRSGGGKGRPRRGEHTTTGKRGRGTCNSEEEEALSRFRHLPVAKKSKRTDSPNQGPILSITGRMDDVLSCKVINSSDGGTANTRRVSRVLSIPSSVTLKGPTSDASNVTVHPKGKWLCSFCGKRSFYGALGVLYGPYYPAGTHTDHIVGMDKVTPKTRGNEPQTLPDKKMPLKSPSSQGKGSRRPIRTYPGKTKNGPTFLSISPPPRNAKLVKGSSGVKSGAPSGGSSGGVTTSSRSRSMELEREEVWVHEDCLIWSQGVFSVGGTLHGLHAAVKEAITVVCTRCQDTGATLGCRTKGCIKAFHYLCAIEVGCILHDDNFSMTCPQHKNKKLKMREAPT